MLQGLPVPEPVTVGMTGVTTGVLAPEGRVRVRGEIWNARTTDGTRMSAEPLF